MTCVTAAMAINIAAIAALSPDRLGRLTMIEAKRSSPPTGDFLESIKTIKKINHVAISFPGMAKLHCVTKIIATTSARKR